MNTAKKAPAKKTPAKKAPARKAPATKTPARKAPATRTPARKAPATKTPARKAPARKAPPAKPAGPRKIGPRADFGAPIDGFFARQPAALRPVVDALRALVEAAAPDATASLKWGMPVYVIDDVMMCAIGGHKAHVNLILSGPAATFPDPEGRLTGEGKTGRHLKLRSLDELPQAQVRAWLSAAAARARAGG